MDEECLRSRRLGYRFALAFCAEILGKIVGVQTLRDRPQSHSSHVSVKQQEVHRDYSDRHPDVRSNLQE